MSTPEPEVSLSAVPLRHLSATDLGIDAQPAIETHSSNVPDDAPISELDPRYQEVLGLLGQFGGVIFAGPPGTSKSWYASKIGSLLVEGDKARIHFVQFHPSYQYEDFIQGFVPDIDGSGFKMTDKIFVAMCRRAALPENAGKRFVLVIDELSRADPGRVFGEALTYVERSKRELPFDLASGESLTVPPNLVVLATMNPLDRGVDEVDAAFERRFAKIAMEPDRDILSRRLDDNGVPVYLRTGIVNFFNRANGYARQNPHGTIGHTYFWDVSDAASLRSVWDHQLRFLVEKAYRLDPETKATLEGSFEALFEPPAQEEPEAGEQGDEGADSARDEG
jgi:5-methylcytosine-specific restriction protein B